MDSTDGFGGGFSLDSDTGGFYQPNLSDFQGVTPSAPSFGSGDTPSYNYNYSTSDLFNDGQGDVPSLADTYNYYPSTGGATSPENFMGPPEFNGPPEPTWGDRIGQWLKTKGAKLGFGLMAAHNPLLAFGLSQLYQGTVNPDNKKTPITMGSVAGDAVNTFLPNRYLAPLAATVTQNGIDNQSLPNQQQISSTFGQGAMGALGRGFAGAGVPGPVVGMGLSALNGQTGPNIQYGGTYGSTNPYQAGLGDPTLSGLNLMNARQGINDLNSQKASLAGLFSPNGAYAQQLRHSIAARNSADGTRGQTQAAEVALMADLAKNAAASAPQLGRIDENLQAARTQRNAQLYNLLYDAFRG